MTEKSGTKEAVLEQIGALQKCIVAFTDDTLMYLNTQPIPDFNRDELNYIIGRVAKLKLDLLQLERIIS